MPADYGAPVPVSTQHFPKYLIVVIVLAVVGILSAVFTAGTLIVHRCEQPTHFHCDYQASMNLAAAYSWWEVLSLASQASRDCKCADRV